MKTRYYLYAYANNQLLLITTNKKQYDKTWNEYERAGVMCWGVDTESMINNLLIEQKEAGL